MRLPTLLIAAVLTGMSGAAAPVDPAAPPQLQLRFHHLHYRVGDPARAMNHAAQTLGGTRILLQGHGVGVQVDEHYALFDRFQGEEPRSTPGAAEAYAEAVAWLQERGFSVPGDFPGARLAAVLPGEYLDHVAFEAQDLAAARDRLASAGAAPDSERDEAVLYRIPGGFGVELLAPGDGEDAFWCPMHPDVRSAEASATCRLCGMPLVAIPPPQIGEYRMDVTVQPAPGGRGASGLRLVIRHPDASAPVPSFAVVHERPFHLFIVDRSLDYFEHVHPEPAGEGAFELAHDIPPGEYMLIADFLPQGGTAQTVQRAIVTPGHDGPLMPPAPRLQPGPTDRVVGGLRIAIDAAELAARKEARIQFTMFDAVTGVPVTDLEPYLGAPAHLLIVNADLTEALHGHPVEQATTGPTVPFAPLMPMAGAYKLWVQVQRGGRVITAPFVIEVVER
ncbi:MAG: hypothetical protein H0X67_05455 [Acidobacteria bacterium]|nr:hypothetical protein [Acidobacteriota bacterium]